MLVCIWDISVVSAGLEALEFIVVKEYCVDSLQLKLLIQ